MKALINGRWFSDLKDTPELRQARIEEAKTAFRHTISDDGSSPFRPEPGRYHLYVSYACPWAHRTVLYRALKKLEPVISLSVLDPLWGGPDGWRFGDSAFSTPDHANGFDFLYQVYQAAKPDFTGKVTVPVLWDKKNRTIVNNQSGEIIRLLNSAFDCWADATVDFYPKGLRSEIDAINQRILPSVCAGVYEVGFASDQAVYDRAVARLFDELDHLEVHLSKNSTLVGGQITEADWHLFATLVRFDAVYHSKLKCTVRRLIDYPNLCRYVKSLYQHPGVAETVRLDHVKRHYFDDLGIGNANLMVADPAIDFRNFP